MKKFLSLVLIGILSIGLVTGCGSKKEDDKSNKNDKEQSEKSNKNDKEQSENKEMSVKEIIDKVYEGIPEDKMPALGQIEINDENLSSFLGVKKLDYKEAVASEPMMGSIAWSVVVVEVKDGVDVKATKKEIKKKVDPRKWICVEAEEVKVESKGNKIILIMMSEENASFAKIIADNFKKLG